VSQLDGPLLDGKDPASAFAATSREPPKGCSSLARGLYPERPREGHSAVLVEPRSPALPRSAYRPRCSRPRSGLATLPLAPSLAILRGPDLFLAEKERVPIASDRRTPRRRCLVKGHDFAGPGRLPSPSAPSPNRASSVLGRAYASPEPAFHAWDHEEPATGITARVLVAFATATRLPAPFRPRSSPKESQRTRPRPLGLDQALLVDFCNHHNPRAQPQDRLIPGSRSANVRSRAPLAYPRFRGARRPHRHAWPKPFVTVTAPAPSTGDAVSSAPRRPRGLH